MATPTTLPDAFTSGQVLTAAEMNALRGAFRILQVVSTTKTDTFSASLAGSSTISVTGLAVTITPTSATSNVLVSWDITGTTDGARGAYVIIDRGGTSIGIGDTAGSRSLVTGSGVTYSPTMMTGSAGSHLDSPATTSPTTYTVQLFNSRQGSQTVYVNRTATDTDQSDFGRAASRITVMEVSA